MDYHAVSVDDINLRDLHEKSEYEVRTRDNWTLVITRYRPKRQRFEQPIFGQPILLVHGFAQNRHTWTSGEFVKNLLYFGADIHILELRGHGKSSRRLQLEKHAENGLPLPGDLDYDWDIDSYLMYDLPAAVEGVKKTTHVERIFYVGHSMGGILGYGYAAWRNDLMGLVTIGSPSDLGRGLLPLRFGAYLIPGLKFIDLLFEIDYLQQRATTSFQKLFFDDSGELRFPLILASDMEIELHEPKKLEFKYFPLDEYYEILGKILSPKRVTALEALFKMMPLLYNPARFPMKDFRLYLNKGGERGSRRVVEQFARWVRNGHLKYYRMEFDVKKNFKNISIPMAIIFGDRDVLANLKSTRSIYKKASSEYLLWRPVRGNSHIDLTMGHDIRQICYDIKNLMDYAVKHQYKRPSLPRKDSGEELKLEEKPLGKVVKLEERRVSNLGGR